MSRIVYQGQKSGEKVVPVSYGQAQFLAGMAMLILCLWLLSSDVEAQYDIHNTGSSNVHGLSGVDVRPAIGSDFGTVSAIADYNYAYGLFGNGGDVEISGNFGAGGTIYAEAGNDWASGLYSDYASSITTGDIIGTVTANSANDFAFGLFSYDGSITTGAINGALSATAGNETAYGLRSTVSITTGAIDGTVTADAR